MSAEACAIAVSEMVGRPTDQICFYVVVAAIHEPDLDAGHEVLIMPGGAEPDWPVARELLGKAAKALR